MPDYHSWTENPVPHFGNDLKYKTDLEHEREYYEKKLEDLGDD